MREIDIKAEEAKIDVNLMSSLIMQYDNFILKCASSASHNYISKNDDEYSVAMNAFSEAIKNYSMDKGSFLNFAELVIRRRIIDFIRSKSRFAPEISINPSLFNSDKEENEESISMKIEITEKMVETNIDNSLKLEIELANDIFSSYGFTFMSLSDCSPKAKKTKAACASAVAYILKNNILVSNMKVKKMLPVNVVEKNAKVPRKILERHRKYIIAAVEILSGDFPYLAEYIRFIREEFEK
ncbi:MAG: polymerase, sigma 28 subunit, FliA/WhiG subfamily [Bacillota bacterium]|jgi:RNA polymerase sigma factor|nr:polymerase, sigma 28 subunit, FliA/WhiG subfamily [Bacillota bacterium]